MSDKNQFNRKIQNRTQSFEQAQVLMLPHLAAQDSCFFSVLPGTYPLGYSQVFLG